MTASYLIGLREGLEAVLVVSILIAFLVRGGRRDRLPLVWSGVAVAVAVSVSFGAVLSYTSHALDSDGRELFEGVASIAAVVFVTWMIFWMRRTARRLSGDLRARLADAVGVGGFAVAGTAFLAVVREGLETALLFFSAVQGATARPAPLFAITAGLLTAVGLGWLLYASVVRINLSRFFTWTGVLLILVAAGILKYGVRDLQELGLLPGAGRAAFNLTAALPPHAWYTTLLGNLFNITPRPTLLEVIAWSGYAVTVLALFLRPARKASARLGWLPAWRRVPQWSLRRSRVSARDGVPNGHSVADSAR